MKRDTAIEHIVNVLRLTGNHYCEDGRDFEDADRILKRLEQLGMLPPKAPMNILTGEDHYWEDE